MCALSTLLTQGNSGANSSLHFAELAQLVERRLAKAKVAGSNPVFRSNPRPRFQRLSRSRGFRACGLLHRLGTKMEHPDRRKCPWPKLDLKGVDHTTGSLQTAADKESQKSAGPRDERSVNGSPV